jgi:ketopantoate hydroxymethyltransferase
MAEHGPLANAGNRRSYVVAELPFSTHRGPSDLPKAAVYIAYRLLRRIRSVEAKMQHSDSLQRLRVVLERESS